MGWILVYYLPCSICGRGIMVARQLPKLKTRVRFPSPAPHFAFVMLRVARPSFAFVMLRVAQPYFAFVMLRVAQP